MAMLFQLLYNLSILVSISIISGFIGYKGRNARLKSISQGVLFGSASVIGMLHPLVLSPGLIFDGRSVMISLSGLFFGPVTSSIAGVIALAYRISQGGTGVIMGTLVIIMSAVVGTIFNIRNKRKNIEVTTSLLYLVGIIVHILMILFMFTLPGGKSLSTIKLIGLPILFAYPIATVLIGRILLEADERRKMVAALKESEMNLMAANQNLNASMEEIVAIEEELRSQFEELSITNALLTESESQLNGALDNAPIPIMLRTDDGKVLKVSRKWTEITGYTIDDIPTVAEWTTKAYGTDNLRVQGLIKESFELGNPVADGEFEVRTSEGKVRIWQFNSSNIGKLSDGRKVAMSAATDITERKRSEEEILYLSYHDQLTGLYNRRFYEEELMRLDTKRNLPMSIVMGDVNGLKLINDSFGHAMGDELLKTVAKVISVGCREDDIIARLGGDEFVILLPRTGADEVEKIITRIKKMALMEKVGSMNISISFGMETKTKIEEDVQDIFRKAEDRMYKEKLYESPSMRSRTINAIVNALNEKNKREEAHSKRVSRFCEDMGKALNLLESEIQELKTVGLLHDIGKITIDENILNKPGKLDANEWEEIKRHPETGYRILSTVNDMPEIADYVLAHHERYDGKGYPKGLKGEEIPFVSRIIAIADAYDAITSERSYRSALSREYAIEELQKNAGIQFDPNLVKIFIENALGVLPASQYQELD